MIFDRKRDESIRRPHLMEGQDDISFRRSRTLQGTTSPTVKTVKQRRAELKSERLNKQAGQRRRRFILFCFAALVVAVGTIWYLISQYTVDIGKIRFATSVKSQPSENTYRQAIYAYLSEHPAERFRFVLSDKRLSEYMSSILPEVKSVKKDGGLTQQPDFSLQLRKPIASWKSGNAASYVDESGVSFTKNYFAMPSVSIVDASGVSAEQNGSTVVSERLLRFLGRLVALTNASGLGQVSEAALPKATTREIDIKIKDRSYLIKTHIDRDPAATVEDMKRVVEHLEQKKVTPVYIDVRVSGRAFYK